MFLFLRRMKYFISPFFIIFFISLILCFALPETNVGLEKAVNSIKTDNTINSSDAVNPSNSADTDSEKAIKKFQYKTEKLKMTNALITLFKSILALIASLLGFIGLLLFKNWRKKGKIQDRQNNSFIEWSKENLNPLQISNNFKFSFRKPSKKLPDDFFDIIFNRAESDYLKRLYKVFISKKNKDILTACNNLHYLLPEASKKDFFKDVSENSFKIISEKCNTNNIQALTSIFKCLSLLYKFGLPSSCIDIFLKCFDKLLEPKLPVKVKNFAARELSIFVEETPMPDWDARNKYSSVMKKVFHELDSRLKWETEDLRIVMKYITNLIYCKNDGDMINELLPIATKVAGRQVNLLIDIYHKTITKIDPGITKTDDVVKEIEGWLKQPEVKDEFKEKNIPLIIKHLCPARKIRHPFSRHKIERTISIKQPNDKEFELIGTTIDISEKGVCFEVDCGLEDDYQKRATDKQIFTVIPGKKQLSDIKIKIFDPKGETSCIEADASICRAWRAPSSSNYAQGHTTRFGAFVKDINLLHSFAT